MPQQVKIVGDGLAACCAAHLLLRRGIAVSVSGVGSVKPAHLLVSEQTQKLLCDVFTTPNLFEDAVRVRRRIVSWGNQPAVDFPHSALVVSEQELLKRLWAKAGVEVCASAEADEDANWTILSSSRIATLPQAHSFGYRQASVIPALLNSAAPTDCCWAESVDDGWLFLLPTGGDRATLICSGRAPERLLEESRLIRDQITVAEREIDSANRFPTFPRILSELHGAGWLACGSAAMTFDPLCGEGAGHAAREAILAAAVIAAATNRSSDPEGLLAHYSARMRQGFLRHLQVCLSFYQSGGSIGFWREEADELRRGVAFMQQGLAAQPALTHRLIGYALEPVSDVITD